jgi:hypothetical protein
MAKSRGAGAAQRGFEYDVYRKGGTVKKYASGGSMKSIPQSEEERKAEQPSYLYEKTPSRFEKMTSDIFTRVPSTLKGLGEDIRHVGGNLSNAAKTAAPTAAEKELARKRSTPSTGAFRKGGKIKKYAEGGEVDREVRRPVFAKEMLPTRPTSQQRRMARRAPPPAPPRPSDTDVMRDILKDMTREERVRKAEMPSEIYRKGGGVKMAGGGTCRGMGAATKGGKYTIK